MARPRGTDSAQVIQVIKTESLRGKGRVRSMSLIISADSNEAVLTLSKDEVFKSHI